MVEHSLFVVETGNEFASHVRGPRFGVDPELSGFGDDARLKAAANLALFLCVPDPHVEHVAGPDRADDKS